MHQSRARRLHPAVLTSILIAASGLAACGSKSGAGSPPASAPPDVWAVVDGRELKRDDVEKAYRSAAPASTSSDEELLAAKLSLLDELITKDILLARAKA